MHVNGLDHSTHVTATRKITSVLRKQSKVDMEKHTRRRSGPMKQPSKKREKIFKLMQTG